MTTLDCPGRTVIALLPAAVRGFGRRVHAVGPDGWSRRTPCRGWRVGELVNHVTAVHLLAAELLAGRTVAELGDRFTGDVLGGRPEEAWDAAADAAVDAWRAVRPETLVALSCGDVPAATVAELMLLALLAHTWDLATALERPDRPELTRLDPAQVAQALDCARAHTADLARSACLGPALVAPGTEPLPEPDARDDAQEDPQDDQAVLLRLLGRDPPPT